MTTHYDYVIIGAGPAGLTAAITVSERVAGSRVLVLEKGQPLQSRACAVAAGGQCRGCSPCSVLSGVGGASGTLGGKLCYFPAGERLASLTRTSCAEANTSVVDFLTQLDLAPPLSPPEHICRPEQSGRVSLKPYTSTRHLKYAFAEMFRRLLIRAESLGVRLYANTEVVSIAAGKGRDRFSVVTAGSSGMREVAVSGGIVWAGGRSGWERFSNCLGALDLPVQHDFVDVGVRLIMPADTAAPVPLLLSDPKLTLRQGQPDEVRTLCWTIGGELTSASVKGLRVVDGHFGIRKTEMASVSVVARLPVPTDVTPIEVAHSNYDGLLAGTPGCESLAGFMGSRSPVARCTAVPRTVSGRQLHRTMSPELRDRLQEMIEGIDAFLEGRLFGAAGTFVAGPVLDKFWGTPTLSRDLMTSLDGLYVAGDATGHARGIVQAIFSGQTVGRSLARRHHSGEVESLRPASPTCTCGTISDED